MLPYISAGPSGASQAQKRGFMIPCSLAYVDSELLATLVPWLGSCFLVLGADNLLSSRARPVRVTLSDPDRLSPGWPQQPSKTIGFICKMASGRPVAKELEGYPSRTLATATFFKENEPFLSHSNIFDVCYAFACFSLPFTFSC